MLPVYEKTTHNRTEWLFGSRKTTLLNHVLLNKQGLKVAVIVSEIPTALLSYPST